MSADDYRALGLFMISLGLALIALVVWGLLAGRKQ